jgi:hypothetical protein
VPGTWLLGANGGLLDLGVVVGEVAVQHQLADLL